MEASELRLILIAVGALILAAVYWFGRARTPRESAVPLFRELPERRREPRFGLDGSVVPDEDEAGRALDLGPELSVDPQPMAVEERRVEATNETEVRLNARPDKVITLHVMAPEGGVIHGAELVVAAEKASLVHHGGLYHRLLDGRSDSAPIFSVINRVRPGHFDLSNLAVLQTPGISLFMTLPGPLPALDAWEKMLPAAQRLAELLHAQVFDAEMNALGRQRIASLRDELRAFDRKQESREIRPRW